MHHRKLAAQDHQPDEPNTLLDYAALGSKYADDGHFDDRLAGAPSDAIGLSHVPLRSGYDEPETLSYQTTLIGPIRPDGRQ